MYVEGLSTCNSAVAFARSKRQSAVAPESEPQVLLIFFFFFFLVVLFGNWGRRG